MSALATLRQLPVTLDTSTPEATKRCFEQLLQGYARLVQELDVALDAAARANRAFSGVGTPEGFVAAPVGSIYQRLDGGASTSLYVKEDGGSGKTGWGAK